MSQQRVSPANRRVAAPDTKNVRSGPPPALLLALQAAATGIVAPTGWGKSRKVRSLPRRGNVRIAKDSSPKKRMRAMRRGVPCP